MKSLPSLFEPSLRYHEADAISVAPPPGYGFRKCLGGSVRIVPITQPGDAEAPVAA